MTDIRFYHLQQQSLEQALPLLLRKALDNGKRILVRTGDKNYIEGLSEALWGYRNHGFIPHGAVDDAHSEDQPVLLTAAMENLNKADMLVLTGGSDNSDIADYSLCCEMLNGHNADEVQTARAHWKAYKEAGHSITYWKQTDNGGWEQKA
jgi:DNA polymerase-3 subunit chi